MGNVRRSAVGAMATYMSTVFAGSEAPAAMRRSVTQRQRIDLAFRLRPRLISRLDSYGERSPTDDWIVGHRVGLRIKQGWVGEAVQVARACQGTQWWCASLLGFALHEDGRFAEASAAFDAALAAMPEGLRCEWTGEFARLLTGGLHAEFAAATCAQRIQLEERTWWLADPLYLMEGNDRRTEHYSRLVGMRLHHEQLELRGLSRDKVHHAAVIAGGWPTWWWTNVGSWPSGGPGYRFVPATETAQSPLQSTAADWDLGLTQALERYFPAYGPMSDLPQQTAFFLRGDSVELVTVAGGDAPSVSAGVVLARDVAEPNVVLEASGWPLRVRRIIAASPYLVSVEAVFRNGAGRTRFGHAPPEPNAQGLGTSDLLFFQWQENLAEDLDAVFPHILPGTALRHAEPVGLYWEVYGSTARAELETSLTVDPGRPGFLQRMAQTLGLGEARGVSVAWKSPPRGHPGSGRTMRLDLSALSPGSYVLELEVRDSVRGSNVIRQPFEIVR